MSLRAVCVDFGGVLVRTEHEAPREHLAQRLGLDYEALYRLVFESKSSRRASVGEISAEEHWNEVARHLGIPSSEIESVRSQFFAGDFVDHRLLGFLRSLRPSYKTALISNAWSDLREYITRQGFADVFDAMVISAEVGVMKPDERIYRIALERLGVRPEEALFVDDFEVNVESARSLGMRGIHFRAPEQALAELSRLLG